MKKLLVLCMALTLLALWTIPTFAATKHKKGCKKKVQTGQQATAEKAQ